MTRGRGETRVLSNANSEGRNSGHKFIEAEKGIEILNSNSMRLATSIANDPFSAYDDSSTGDSNYSIGAEPTCHVDVGESPHRAV